MFNPSSWKQVQSSFQEPVDAPGVDPDTGAFVYFGCNVEWLPYVLGALKQLCQTGAWNGDEADKQLAVDRATLLLNTFALPIATSPGNAPGVTVLYRYNASNGHFETSVDNGTTWTDSPSSNPQVQTTLPAQTGAGAECNSAASEIAYLARFLNMLNQIVSPAVTATGLAYGILGELIQLSSFWLDALEVIVVASTTLLAAGLSAINAAFSPTNMDTLLCILYCERLGGQFDVAALGRVEAQVTSQIGGTDASIINLILSLQGFGGINQAMNMKLDTDTCAGCGCSWTHTFTFATSGDKGFFYSPNTCGQSGGAGIGAVGYQSGDFVLCSGVARRVVTISKTFAQSVHVTGISLVYGRTAGTFDATLTALLIGGSAGTLDSQTNLTVVNGSNVTRTITGSWNLTSLLFLVSSSARGTNAWNGSCNIIGFTLAGDGYDPFA